MAKPEAVLKRIERENEELRRQLRLLEARRQRHRDAVEETRRTADRRAAASRGIGQRPVSRVLRLAPLDIQVPVDAESPEASEPARGTGERLAEGPAPAVPPVLRVPTGQGRYEWLRDERTQELVDRANRAADRRIQDRYGAGVSRFLREQRRRRAMRAEDLPRTDPLPWYIQLRRPPNAQEIEQLRREPITGNIAGIGVGILRSLNRLWESVQAIPELPEAIWQLVTTLNRPEHLFDWEMRAELADAVVLAPFRAIAADLEAAVAAAEEGDQIESSARIIEATIRVLEIIAGIRATLGAARRLPASVRRLEAVGERLRRSRQLDELKRLVRDERGSLRAGIWRQLAGRRVDVDDPYTAQRIAEMYALARSRDIPFELQQMRANFGELRTLLRFAEADGVERVRFLRPTSLKGEVRPDIEVVFRAPGASPLYVEVRTFTQAPRGAEIPTGAARRAPLRIVEADVQRKIRHGQINAQRPGVVVFHGTFQNPPSAQSALAGWRDVLAFLRHEPQPGLTGVEVSTGSGLLLRFEPPGWQGRVVQAGR